MIFYIHKNGEDHLENIHEIFMKLKSVRLKVHYITFIWTIISERISWDTHLIASIKINKHTNKSGPYVFWGNQEVQTEEVRVSCL